MKTIMKKVSNDYKNQKMNEKQKYNWISIDEIKEKSNVLSLDAILMLNKENIPNQLVMIKFLIDEFLIWGHYAAEKIIRLLRNENKKLRCKNR